MGHAALDNDVARAMLIWIDAMTHNLQLDR
jgi:hypothetical protein